MEPTLELIGASASRQALNAEIDLAARSDAKVLITGESGVGKDIVARLIHQRSRRRQAPLITINCAGIPDTLLASELFGHMRGSFTDAHRDKAGYLEQAHRGTIFLDEVGEMSGAMQALLLRFLENGEIQRVGSDRRTVVDVRVIAATNRNLLDRVAANEFREDLFYRLNVIHLEISPLRDRRDDIPVLVAHFLGQFSQLYQVPAPTLTPEALAALHAAAWRGNVRQLRNVSERLVVRTQGRVVTVDDLPREVFGITLGTHSATTAAAPTTASTASRVDSLFTRMVHQGDHFWTVVHGPFAAHDITRDELRALIAKGLQVTHGSYKLLTVLFNLPPQDYKRFLNFLRKAECQLPFLAFRTLSAQTPESRRPTPLNRSGGLDSNESQAAPAPATV